MVAEMSFAVGLGSIDETPGQNRLCGTATHVSSAARTAAGTWM